MPCLLNLLLKNKLTFFTTNLIEGGEGRKTKSKKRSAMEVVWKGMMGWRE